MHVQGYFAHILIPQNASSWRRLSTVIPWRATTSCAADAYQTLYGAFPDAWLSVQRYFELWPCVINCAIQEFYDYPSGLVSPGFTSHDNLALAAACRNSSASVLAFISLHHASGRRITCRRVRLNYQCSTERATNRAGGKRHSFIFREVDDFAASVEIVKQVCAETALLIFFITISMR